MSIWHVICVYDESGRDMQAREIDKAARDAKWRVAMEEEMHTLAENETWDTVDAFKGVKPIGCKWVYKVIQCQWLRRQVQGPIGGRVLCTATRHQLR